MYNTRDVLIVGYVFMEVDVVLEKLKKDWILENMRANLKGKDMVRDSV